MDTYHDFSLHPVDNFVESLYYPRSSSRFLYGYGYNDSMVNGAAGASLSVSENSEGNNSRSPPKHRHDGTSPLPLGMDWSRPPRIWDGKNSVWPHGSHSRWSYCVTIPSWTVVSKTSGSDFVVFYRVQVGLQSPEGITSTRGILRRYSDFVKFSSDLKKEFPKKKLPPYPPKGILRLKSKELMEERRCSLEVWMEKLLSDIDISRSFPVATFLELEAAARSSFHECYDNGIDANSAFGMVQSDLTRSASSLVAGTSIVTDSGNDSSYGTPELGDESTISSGNESFMLDSNIKRPLQDCLGNDIMSSERLEPPESVDLSASSDLQLDSHLSMVLSTNEQEKINRVFTTTQLRLATASTDIENLIARLNQELAVRHYLLTKVKDLETELETTKQSKEETLQQADISERERVNQTQWDMDELRRYCMEMELKLKHVQAENVVLNSEKASAVQQNESLLKELEVAKAQAEHLRKSHEESELKEEIKALQNSQAELKEEISRLRNEKEELEVILQQEKGRSDMSRASNEKLLHEYKILRGRLEECRVNYLVEGDKLIMNTSSPYSVRDSLTTCDTGITNILEQAQIFARDIDLFAGKSRTRDDELRKMLTDVLIENGGLRKQINSIIRCVVTRP